MHKVRILELYEPFCNILFIQKNFCWDGNQYVTSSGQAGYWSVVSSHFDKRYVLSFADHLCFGGSLIISFSSLTNLFSGSDASYK